MIQRTQTWKFRLAAIFLGLLPVLSAEMLLRLMDLPKKPPATDPFVDLHALAPLFVASEDNPGKFQIPPNRLNLFRAAEFRIPKPTNTFRVFALGGSTTQGEPFSTDTAFPRWLGLCLQSGTSEYDVEVINCGGLSYASYRVLAILREVLKYEPDLIVVYTGHNEFLERRSYEGFQLENWRNTTVSRLSNLRLVQVGKLMLGRDGYRPGPAVNNPTQLAREVDALLDYEGGLNDYHRDETLRRSVVEHFRWNLNQIVTECQSSSVPLILMKPVSNILDCPPIKIEIDRSLSVEDRDAFEQVWRSAREARDSQQAYRYGLASLELDAEHAGANYLVGRLLVESGKFEAAMQYLTAARDNDVCPLRAISQIADTVEMIATTRGVPMIDAEEILSSKSPHSLVGSQWLVDHIHPSVEGHQLLGLNLAMECDRLGLLPGMNSRWQDTYRDSWNSQLETLGEDYFLRGKQRLEGLLLWTQGRARKVRNETETDNPH